MTLPWNIVKIPIPTLFHACMCAFFECYPLSHFFPLSYISNVYSHTQLGMAILPNDGKCHMEKSQLGDFYEYSGATDYVTLELSVLAMIYLHFPCMIGLSLCQSSEAACD